VLVVNAELPAENFVDLPGKEGDLPLIVILVVEESVPTQAAPGDTLDGSDLDDWFFAGRSTVVPKEVVPRRNIEPKNLDHLARYFRFPRMRQLAGLGRRVRHMDSLIDISCGNAGSQ
jgi:hypothetical protein